MRLSACLIIFPLFFTAGFASATCNSALPVSTGHLKAGAQAGTVVDSKTKLMWKKCLEGLSGDTCGTGTVSTFDWNGALSRPSTVNSTGFAGYSDWRLPNIKELQSIVEEQCYSPAVNATMFPNVSATSQVWSSSPYSESTGSSPIYWKSYAVNFASGSIVLPLSRATNTLHVRFVRDCTGTECD